LRSLMNFLMVKLLPLVMNGEFSFF
jgi:hypothetical protein